MLWGRGPFTINGGPFPNKRAPATAKAYSMNGRPTALAHRAGRRRSTKITKERRVCRFLDPFASLRGVRNREMCSASSSAAGRFPSRDRASPNGLKKSGKAGARASANAALGTENRTDPVMVGLGPHAPCLDPTLNFPRHQRTTPAIIDRAAAPPVHMVYAERPLAGPFRSLRQIRATRERPRATIRRSAKDQSGHPIQHRFTKLDSDEPVHRLPRPTPAPTS